ncbi:MAG: PIN domain-containing protein [Terracidiphilus sp.]
MTASYLDTQVAVWLATGKLSRFSSNTRNLLEATDLLLSPIVPLELEYLYELKRIKLPARDIQRKLEHELGLRLCDLPFATIAGAALDEKWSRDPFDRLIVANAKANGFAWLITADEEMRKHYPRTLW